MFFVCDTGGCNQRKQMHEILTAPKEAVYDPKTKIYKPSFVNHVIVQVVWKFKIKNNIQPLIGGHWWNDSSIVSMLLR